jgi:hypothetical protein
MLDAGLRLDPLIGNQGGCEWGVYWDPVNASTVKQLAQLLSRSTSVGTWHWLCELVGPLAKHTMFRLSGEHCQQFETALYTAAIETALVTDCRRLKTKLLECIEQTKRIRDRETETLLSRWCNADQQC